MMETTQYETDEIKNLQAVRAVGFFLFLTMLVAFSDSAFPAPKFGPTEQKGDSGDLLIQLLKTKSSREFEQLKLMDRETHHQEHLCRAQIRFGRIPTACFAVKSKGVSAADSVWLQSLCISRAEFSRSLRELRSAEQAGGVPDSCLGKIRQRAGDLSYIELDSSPAEHFDRSLEPRSGRVPSYLSQ